MKPIILHIGLPKTATTLVQKHVFSVLTEHIDYLGVRQPRTREQDTLYREIISIVFTNSQEYEQRISHVKRLVNERISMNDKPFILSEEMLCVDSGETTWQEKLSRLADIFNKYKVHILVTVREPVAAVFSYFIETFHSTKYKNILDFVRNSNGSKIYDYYYLNATIVNTFKNFEINYVPFELIKEDKFIDEIILRLNIKSDASFSSPVINNKKENTKVVFTHKKNLNSYLRSKLKNSIFINLIKLPAVKPIAKKVAKLIKNIDTPFSQVKIPKLTSDEQIILNKIYCPTSVITNNKMTIDYR
ncbi:hypothetical protein [Colwellia sp. C1TZA3]|uniref:hypothetical protein n=1 Tax=Colwellia sp. C1TZA3 TaxID=2508879 RepID=UPI0011BA3CC9|nr:hypothetical protein [Colwellia sp. C1TZA3]TWX67634.1 hypothetical protein ESZ39_12985 [Colwellia sp. C1TZA3]